MGNISVSRYDAPEKVGYLGWIEPEDKSWIVFIRDDGTPELFTNREPVTGAV